MPRLIPFARIAAPCLAAAAFAVSLNAQDRTADPGIDTLLDRIADERVLFGVEIESEVTDDLLELGRLVAMGGAAEGGAAMACISCHGAQGAGDGSGAFPRLAGQPGWYLYKQLVDYASGERPNAIMTGIASRLSEREMEAVAAYYAAVEAPFRPVLGSVDAQTLQWGGQLAAVGSAERGIPACVNCHGPEGTGLPPAVPYLAGQYATYMQHQLQLWADGVRNNDAMDVMSTIAQAMTEEDMRAVSEYFARIQPVEETGAGVRTAPAPVEPGSGDTADQPEE